MTTHLLVTTTTARLFLSFKTPLRPRETSNLSAPRAWFRRTCVVIVLPTPSINSLRSNGVSLCALATFFRLPWTAFASHRHDVGQTHSVCERQSKEACRRLWRLGLGASFADIKAYSIAIVNSDKVRRPETRPNPSMPLAQPRHTDRLLPVPPSQVSPGMQEVLPRRSQRQALH